MWQGCLLCLALLPFINARRGAALQPSSVVSSCPGLGSFPCSGAVLFISHLPRLNLTFTTYSFLFIKHPCASSSSEWGEGDGLLTALATTKEFGFPPPSSLSAEPWRFPAGLAVDYHNPPRAGGCSRGSHLVWFVCNLFNRQGENRSAGNLIKGIF